MLRRVALSFVKTFAATFAVLTPGILYAPNLGAARAAAVAVLVGALDAALKAAQTKLAGTTGSPGS